MRPIIKKNISGMNRLEQKYANHLAMLKCADEIDCYFFEKVGLRLANKCFFYPDFLVVYNDRFEFHEVKGHWEDDALVKIKVAAQMYPFYKFIAIEYKNKAWVYRNF